MKKRFALLLSAAVVCGWTFAAVAQQQPANKGGQQNRQIFQKADTNKDGKITFEELSAALPNMTKEKFDKIDRNKDGAITQADNPAEPKQQLGQMIEKADADKDGKVTLEEAQKAMPKLTPERFAKMDKNGDGALTQADVPAPKLPAGAKMGAEERMAALKARFAKSDADGDGKVTLEEFMKQPGSNEEMFKRLDRNGDGVLTDADVQKPAMPPVNQPRKFDPASVDTNKDGKVSYEEGSAYFQGLSREAFDRLDVNKDGFITKDEVVKPGA